MSMLVTLAKYMVEAELTCDESIGAAEMRTAQKWALLLEEILLDPLVSDSDREQIAFVVIRYFLPQKESDI